MAALSSSETFESMEDLRQRLRFYSSANHCPFYLKSSKPERIDARCPSTKSSDDSDVHCGFNLTGYKHKDGLIHLKKVILQHSPFCTMQPSSSASILSTIASPLLRRYKSFTPGDLCNETQAQHYQHLSYSMAWRALSKCKMDNMLENKRSFMLLNGLFTKFFIHNQESHCILEKNSNDTFERAFLSLRALQLAFRNCRPMIILDACHLRSKYGGVVMSAVAHDGEGSIAPLAVAIASIKNKNNCVFFLLNLLSAIPELSKPGIVVMHNREKDLQNAQK
ncbi:hypothetical protein BASA60_009460 [Batrachochytrium salamandrivorans]|nr:hypothetical protein BASA60_009460 [Batrachochytrium salamandrivorans]